MCTIKLFHLGKINSIQNFSGADIDCDGSMILDSFNSNGQKVLMAGMMDQSIMASKRVSIRGSGLLKRYLSIRHTFS
jgi:hypothetical protein